MAVKVERKMAELYDELHNRGYEPYALDRTGKKTLDPEKSLTIGFTLRDENNIKSDPAYISMEKKPRKDIITTTIWVDGEVVKSPEFHMFHKFIKPWVLSKVGEIEIRKSDHFQFDMQKRAKTKMQQEKDTISEGYYPLGKKTSYSDNVPTVKIIIEHSRNIEEGEQRFRNVQRIFVENLNGERFLLPTNRPGLARVYARHIAEGGTPYDDKAKHITTLVEEYTKMAGFVRATKNSQFNESTQRLINEGVNHYSNLRETLTRLTSRRGYTKYFESYTPVLNEEADEVTNLNELFVQETLDPRIESVMPILQRLSKNLQEMTEVHELANWSQKIVEGGDGGEASEETDGDTSGDAGEGGAEDVTPKISESIPKSKSDELPEPEKKGDETKTLRQLYKQDGKIVDDSGTEYEEVEVKKPFSTKREIQYVPKRESRPNSKPNSDKEESPKKPHIPGPKERYAEAEEVDQEKYVGNSEWQMFNSPNFEKNLYKNLKADGAFHTYHNAYNELDKLANDTENEKDAHDIRRTRNALSQQANLALDRAMVRTANQMSADQKKKYDAKPWYKKIFDINEVSDEVSQNKIANSQEVASVIADSLGGEEGLSSDDIYSAIDEYAELLDEKGYSVNTDKVAQILMDKLNIHLDEKMDSTTASMAVPADKMLDEAPGAMTLKHNQNTEKSNLKAFDLGEGSGDPVIEKMSDEDLADYLGVSVKFVKQYRKQAEQAARDKTDDNLDESCIKTLPGKVKLNDGTPKIKNLPYEIKPNDGTPKIKNLPYEIKPSDGTPKIKNLPYKLPAGEIKKIKEQDTENLTTAQQSAQMQKQGGDMKMSRQEFDAAMQNTSDAAGLAKDKGMQGDIKFATDKEGNIDQGKLLARGVDRMMPAMGGAVRDLNKVYYRDMPGKLQGMKKSNPQDFDTQYAALDPASKAEVDKQLAITPDQAKANYQAQQGAADKQMTDMGYTKYGYNLQSRPVVNRIKNAGAWVKDKFNEEDEEVVEDLDANQKRVGQLGPTEKVKNNNIGKLVGANESAELERIKSLSGIK